MNELQELAHALTHRARACYLTVVGNQRVHAYSMIAGLADLESRLYAWNQDYLSKEIEGMIDTCEKCIKTTLVTGRCYHCPKGKLEELEKEFSQLPSSNWERLEQKP